MTEHEIRVLDKRIVSIHKSSEYPDSLRIEVMGPYRGLYGCAYMTIDDARLLARLLLELAGPED